MAGDSSNIKEEMELSMAEELGGPGSLGQNQEHVVISEIMERGSRSLGTSQRRQKLEPKAAGSPAISSVWNVVSPRPKKRSHLHLPRMLREQVLGDFHPQEYPGVFQGMRFHCDRNLEADMAAEFGPEEFNGLEMEIIKRQLGVIFGRLRALEDQSATRRQREALFFAILVSACITNLWLWVRQ
ncbi:fetal and adult testis-expressed transcript protein [Cynocephalus volans]|uniref:fetal and adult testis-expressed transcript protein n=1 Tax=Cynocephalus volans TaxID=110931 RepID=UPI002FC9BAA7